MEIKEFKKYAIDLDYFTAYDVDTFEFMTDEDLFDYQTDLERNDGDNLSCLDHLRALFTMKKRIDELSNEKINPMKSVITTNMPTKAEHHINSR